MKRFFVLLCLLTCSFLSLNAFAEADSNLWPVLKKSFFGDKQIDAAGSMKLEGPRRAESGAQVPITLTIDKPDAFKNVYLFVDANPIPLAAVYHFTALNGKAQLSTRIRMQTDSFIHAVGETADGKLSMADMVIRAAGGCGGAVDGDDTEIRAAAGKIKLSVETPVKFGEANPVTFLIKHPMFTGLQRDLVSGGYKPAFFISKVSFSYNSKPVMDADFGVAISEDPYMRFFYLPDAPGKLDVTALDNEGKAFTHEVNVSN
ncbi:MAG TPA: quinoprotein dehydrogenase-associated SoxYZ-like carrier [Methylophilaceae bacterium]|jgi:sulfur-oxidizing protein SoxY